MQEPMKLKTEDGTAEPMPLSDIQINNERISRQTIWLKRLVYILFLAIILATLTFWWIIWKVLSSGTVNHYIAACV